MGRKRKLPIITYELLCIAEGLGTIYRLKKIGGSYAVVVPKSWADSYCLIIRKGKENTYWVDVKAELERKERSDKKGFVTRGVLKIAYPDVEKLEVFLTASFPIGKLKGGPLAYPDERFLDIIREMLSQRGFTAEIKRAPKIVSKTPEEIKDEERYELLGVPKKQPDA